MELCTHMRHWLYFTCFWNQYPSYSGVHSQTIMKFYTYYMCKAHDSVVA
uniref:Uncharacterized protein n=1 Tax=Anguilla anguilla TaxID=7936 RepID=A0A0E9SD72_ANGAN